MSDYSNTRIDGTHYQKRKLIETFGAVEKFCKPEAAREIPTTVFIFSKDLPKYASGAQLIRNGQHIVEIPEKFTVESLRERGKVICHELSHVFWDKEHPYTLPAGSKEKELQGIIDEEAFAQDFDKSRRIKYIPESRKEIMAFINSDSTYKKLPEKEPRTKAEFDKVQMLYVSKSMIGNDANILNELL